MNALKVMMIVMALAILAGCAGVERKCIEGALERHVKEVKYIKTFDRDIEYKLDLVHDSAAFSLIMVRSCLNL